MVLFPPSRCKFRSGKVGLEAQNQAKTLEGLQTKKSVNAVLVLSLTSEHMFVGLQRFYQK